MGYWTLPKEKRRTSHYKMKLSHLTGHTELLHLITSHSQDTPSVDFAPARLVLSYYRIREKQHSAATDNSIVYSTTLSGNP